jgi:hypothetical protein
MAKPKCSDKPCAQCPFRARGMAGFTGSASPEELIEATMRDYPMPCHKTIDYDDPTWKEDWEASVEGHLKRARSAGQYCAGALIFFENVAKLSRDPHRPRLKADPEGVFSTPQAFIDYHRSSDVRSWEALSLPAPDTSRVHAAEIAANDALRDAREAIARLIEVDTDRASRREAVGALRDVDGAVEALRVAKMVRGAKP